MKTRRNGDELAPWYLILCLLALVLCLCGCALGRSSRPAGGGGSVALPGGAAAEFRAPSDPAAASSQTVTRRVVRKFAPLAPVPDAFPSPLKAGLPAVVSDSAPPVQSHCAPAPLVLEESQDTATITTGPAHVDTSADTRARIESMRPVQWLGVLFLAAAAASCHPVVRALFGAGKQLTVYCTGAGAACVFGPQLLAGNESLLFWLAAGGAAVVWAVSRLSHKEAQADAARALADLTK